MKSGASFNRAKSKQDYATPPDLIEAVVKRFGPLAWDLAATELNRKAPQFISPQMDSFSVSWHEKKGLLWLNPEFKNIAPWAAKCARESALGAKILFLVPASIGSNWFCDHVHKHSLVLALNGRIHFDPNNPTWGYPKDCILCCYGWPAGFETWRWK